MRHREITLNRDALYELIWTRPIWQLAKEFGLSDVGLGKICRRLSVPTPPRGHWAKHRRGVKTRRTPLPAKAGVDHVVVRLRERSAAPLPTGIEQPAVVLHTDLNQLHRLVRPTAARFARVAPDRAAVVSFGDSRLLAIESSPACSTRALLLMSSLVSALESRGHSVELEPGRTTRTIVVVGGERIRISLKERRLEDTASRGRREGEYRIVSGPLPDPYLPSGKLRFRIEDLYLSNCRKSWADGKTPLEHKLPLIILGIEAAAEVERAERIRWEEERRRRLEEDLAREKEQQRRAAEARREQWLSELANSWVLSRRIRAFARATQREVAAGRVQSIGEAQISWMLSVADRANPLRRLANHSVWNTEAPSSLG